MLEDRVSILADLLGGSGRGMWPLRMSSCCGGAGIACGTSEMGHCPHGPIASSSFSGQAG